MKHEAVDYICYLPSSLSISSYIGCPIRCSYCIYSGIDEFNSKPRFIIDEEKLVDEMLAFKLYNEIVPITVNNQTEPFLNNQIFKSTIRILELLSIRKIKNPIVIITKGYLTNSQINLLNRVNLSKLIICYTFSGLAKIENRNEKKQIETIEKLSKLNNLILLHYHRPIIEGLNTSEEIIRKVASIAIKHCEASIVSGIKVNSFLENNCQKLGIQLTKNLPDNKIILPATYNKICEILKETHKGYPIFKKTSCGISHATNKADYNLNNSKPNFCKWYCKNYNDCISQLEIGFCNSSCHNWQNCSQNEKSLSKHDRDTLLLEAGFDGFEICGRDNNMCLIKGSAERQVITFLRHTTGTHFAATSYIRRKDETRVSE